jgi:hypothetical protein
MRWHRHLLPVVALASAVVLATAAKTFAQEPSEFQFAQIPGWSFTPGIIASSVFDSNVALAAELPTRPETTGDTLFLIEPSGQLEYHGLRTNFETGYRGYLRRYADLDELNGFDQRGYASLRHRATRHTTLFASETFMKVPSTDELELNGVVFARTGSRSNTVAAGADSRLTKYMDLNVRYDLTWVDFERTNILLRSGFVHGVRTELARRLSDRAALGAEYSLRLANLDEGARNFLFQDVGATFRYDTGPRTVIYAAAGMGYLLDRTLHDTRTGPYVRGDITHHEQRATFGAGYQRMFVPTFGFGGSSTSQTVRAYVRMPVNRNRVYVQQSVSWLRSNPLIATTLALDSWWLHSTVGYAMARWLRAEGYYAYTRQDSRVPGGLVVRHRIGGQVVITRPMRIQ